jgi:hypothetical protein
MLISLIYLVVIAAVAGIVWWAIDQLHTPEPINRIVKVAVVVIAFLFCLVIVLQAFGLGGGLGLPPAPRL